MQKYPSRTPPKFKRKNWKGINTALMKLNFCLLKYPQRQLQLLKALSFFLFLKSKSTQNTKKGKQSTCSKFTVDLEFLNYFKCFSMNVFLLYQKNNVHLKPQNCGSLTNDNFTQKQEEGITQLAFCIP